MTRRDLILSAAALPAMAADSPVPVAETHDGKVRGATANGVHIFRGIPYGGPTEGAGRFLPPSKPEKWPGARDCTQTGPRCVQSPSIIFLDPRIGEYFAGGRADRVTLAQQKDSENCLVLNVLTKGLTGKRPVMVYIHGGGFTGGSAQLGLYSDGFVREQDVVLVSVNHRLNVFGYLYLGELSAKYADSGNAGQLDLIAALQWVRDNIAAFGGDPANVTIFGESGGGAKVSALMAMPGARGLFHKAIIESGSALRVGTKDEGTRRARAVLAKLGLAEGQVDALANVPADKLFAAGNAAGGNVGPVLDGRSIPEQTWEPHAPAISAHIPTIIGCCKDERTLFSLQSPELFTLDDAGLRAHLVKAGVPNASLDSLLALYRRDHPKDTPTDIWFRIATDRVARRNAITQAERQLANNPVQNMPEIAAALGITQAERQLANNPNVFMYYFAWNTPLVDGKIKAFHTAELPLAMRLVRYPESEELSKQIAGAWGAFARHGKPDHKGLPHWPAYSLAKRATMIFDTPSAVANDPDRDERLALAKIADSSGAML